MSIARIKQVKKARKDQGTCGGCGKPINKGDAYQWWTVGFRARFKHKRHLGCPVPAPSERESNDKVAAVLRAQEGFDDALAAAGDRDGFIAALTDYAEGIREAAELWNESGDAIEEGFGHETEQSGEMKEKGENAEAVADEIESQAEDLPEEPDEGEGEDDFLDRLREAAQTVCDDNDVEC